jgi:hypothetical protein
VGLRRDLEVDFHAVHGRALHVRDAYADTVEAERRWQALQPGTVEPNVDECTNEHVAGNSARRIENRDLHVNEVEEIDIARPVMSRTTLE